MSTGPKLVTAVITAATTLATWAGIQHYIEDQDKNKALDAAQKRNEQLQTSLAKTRSEQNTLTQTQEVQKQKESLVISAYEKTLQDTMAYVPALKVQINNPEEGVIDTVTVPNIWPKGYEGPRGFVDENGSFVLQGLRKPDGTKIEEAIVIPEGQYTVAKVGSMPASDLGMTREKRDPNTGKSAVVAKIPLDQTSRYISQESNQYGESLSIPNFLESGTVSPQGLSYRVYKTNQTMRIPGSLTNDDLKSLGYLGSTKRDKQLASGGTSVEK